MLKGKKGKKGFTLLELVIAIGLLALFAVFIGVSLNRTFKKQKEILIYLTNILVKYIVIS